MFIWVNPMKKLIPLLLFSSATLHIAIGTSPVFAMGCNSATNKVEVTCAEDDNDCEKKDLANRIN